MIKNISTIAVAPLIVVGMVLIASMWFVPLSAHASIITFLTSGTSYTTPSDWNNNNNSIECIGSGGGGGAHDNGGGGGGGGVYARISNLTLSGSIAYVVATSLDIYFNGAASSTASISCASGKAGSGTTNGAGGLTANSTGTTKFAGGSGGGGGAGGSGGTTAAGSNGAAGAGGAGGTVAGGAGGLNGGGAGGSGTVWQSSPARGAGGGGGLGVPGELDTEVLPYECITAGGQGGLGGGYGGGGGGGGFGPGVCPGGAGGSGTQGIIVTTYTPVVLSIVSGLKIGSFGSLKITGGGLKIR